MHTHIFLLIGWISSFSLAIHPLLIPVKFCRLHPGFIQNHCIQVLAGQLTLVHPWVGVHKKTSVMQYPAYHNWMVWEMGGRWLYILRFVRSYFQDLHTHTHTHTHTELQGSLNKFPDFFHMGTFIDSTHMKL